MAKHDPKQRFDVHRTLSSHRQRPVAPVEDQQTEQPKKGWRSWSKRRWLFMALAVVMAWFVFIFTWDAINISRAGNKLFGSGNILSLAGHGKLNGADNKRVNVLLIGYSIDDPGHPASTLTDSIILLSLSTNKKTSYMLSIPRDLYVNIPGFGYGKINEAYKDGGTKLLSHIVAQNFGVEIDYHVLVNYAAVRNLVNAVGGIDVTIKSPDRRGLYDPNINKHDGGPLKLTNGKHHLDGQTALNLTRARGDDYRSYGFPQADFDRTQHQRQVLTAIKQKLNWWLIFNPLKNGKIAQALAKNIKTDIKANQARPLFGLFNRVPDKELQSVGLRDVHGHNLLMSYNANGSSALAPTAGLNDYSEIQAAIRQLNR